MSHAKFWMGIGALLLLAAGFAALGRWQLQRAEVNRDISNRFVQSADLPVIDRPVNPDEADALRYRRIRLSGDYRPERQILLDNMTHQGRAGYQVLTPFQVTGSDRLLLVNRGFVPAAADRSVLPDVAIPAATGVAAGTATTTVAGRIDRLPRAALNLKAPPTAGAKPVQVLSFPDFDEVEAVLGGEVYRFQLLLDAGSAPGFDRSWSPPEDRARRNIAYAVQWFGLAALALAIALGAAMRRVRRSARVPT